MIIDLTNIDEEGRSFHFDQVSNDLEDALSDLLGTNPYTIDLTLKTLGNTYQASGAVSSHYPEVCSKCGFDIDVPLKARINEILVIEKNRPRNTAVSQSQQSFDPMDPAVTYLNSPELDLAEFLHEIVAANLSNYPACSDVGLCESRRPQQPLVEEVGPGHPGFAALKKLKV